MTAVILILQRIRDRREAAVRDLLEEQSKASKAIRKWKHLSRVSKSLKKMHKPRPHTIRQRPGPLLSTSFDLYVYTGLLAPEFFRILDLVSPHLLQSRNRINNNRRALQANSLIDRARLVLLLAFFRRGSRLDLAHEWGVSPSYISRDIRFLVPILAATCMFIKLPTIWERHPFEDVVGAIDCTSHRRCRVHPHQHDYYRGDKRCFFLSAQVVCGLDGKIFDVAIFPGRVNDQAAFTQTWMEQLASLDIKLLADGGYWDPRLVKPTTTNGQHWNNTQKSLRSVVEHVNSVVQCWRYAAQRIRGQEPELQAYCLRVIYNLAAMIICDSPLHNDLFLASAALL